MTKKCETIDTLRKPKILDMSIFDWITTLIGGYILAVYIFKFTEINDIVIFELLVIIIGIFVHSIFGINTMLGYYLGLNEKPIRTECV